MERCINAATPKLHVGLVLKAASVSATVECLFSRSIVSRTETDRLLIPQSEVPEAGGFVPTLKPPPPKAEERSIPKLKPNSKVPPRPQRQDDFSNGESQAQADHSPNNKNWHWRRHTEIRHVVEEEIATSGPISWKEKESTFNKMPDEAESRGQWETERGLKRESVFEEPERKFRGKDQQQEPRECSNSSQASCVATRRTQHVPIGAKRSIAAKRVPEKKVETQPLITWTTEKPQASFATSSSAAETPDRTRLPGQFGTNSASRDSSVFDVKLELRREEKVDSSVDKWDSWRTWGEASATQPEKNSGDAAPWRQKPTSVQQEAAREENEERIVPRHERSALGQRPVFVGAAPISPGNSLHWQSERSQSSREPRRAVGTQNDRRGYRQQRHASCPSLEEREPPKSDCAFVCVLWGADDPTKSLDACMQAFVLGYSLKACDEGDPHHRATSRHARVLLVTPDLVRQATVNALRLYWDVREIKHVPVSKHMLSACNPRFKHVFTKLRVMELVEFRRIVLLDADMMVKGGTVDEMFDVEVPAALFRGRRDHTPGKARPQNTYYNSTGKLIGGINAGAIVLEPSKAEFKQMQNALRHRGHRCHVPSNQPEQDFLTRWYDKRWRGLNAKFNYQLHQLLLAKDHEELQCDRFRVNYDQVRIVHYSTDKKPSTLILDPKRPTIHDFIDEFIGKHGEPLLPRIKHYIVEAMAQWKRKFEEAWIRGIEDVPKKPARTNPTHCFNCGRAGVVDVNHCFFRCPATARYTKDWRAAVGSPRANLSELKAMPTGLMVEPSFTFLGNVWCAFSYGHGFAAIQPYRAPVMQEHYEDDSDDEDYGVQCWGKDGPELFSALPGALALDRPQRCSLCIDKQFPCPACAIKWNVQKRAQARSL